MDDIWQDMHEKTYDSLIANTKDTYHHVLFTVLIPREDSKSSFVGFLGGDWVCAHIDEFCPANNCSPMTLALENTQMSSLFYDCSHTNGSVPFNQSQFLYKNIQPALKLTVSDPKSVIAHRTHELIDILYRLLKVQNPSTSGK